METGVVVTVVLAIVITIAFVASAKRVIGKFKNGDCCSSGGCSGCNCHCSDGKSKKG